MKAREELRLVTDFAELREGMVVVIKGCDWCGGGSHRGMLSSRRAVAVHEIHGPGEFINGYGFPLMPPALCVPRVMAVGSAAVAAGIVWLVIDGLTDETPTTTATPKTLERVR